MLTLNIIPGELKKEIKFKITYKSLKNMMCVLMIIILVYAIIILAAKLILQMYFVQTIHETTLVTKKTENYSREIRDINSQLNYITEIQDESVEWSYLLEYIAGNVKDGIKFTQIKINKDNNTIHLQGNAKTRDNLLQLKKIFENSNYFSDINFPIKNLLEKNNINFQISAQLKSYEFNQLK